MTCIEYKKMIAEMATQLFAASWHKLRFHGRENTVKSDAVCVELAKDIARKSGIEEPICVSKPRETDNKHPCKVNCPGS